MSDNKERLLRFMHELADLCKKHNAEIEATEPMDFNLNDDKGNTIEYIESDLEIVNFNKNEVFIFSFFLLPRCLPANWLRERFFAARSTRQNIVNFKKN